ncbi:hypothetical protein ACFY7H_01370 [Streptomyces sp. NPDC012794]|uniref:hypothetical protein n=1 Tax=Streptomyces sp. NPDC012794 TaxID=3364850 RepID=UPI00368675D1
MRRGPIRREPNPANRRERLILLAEPGRRPLAEYAGPARRVEERMTAGLCPEETDAFRLVLNEARRALS